MTIIDYIKIPFYWLFKIIYGIFFILHFILEKASVGVCFIADFIIRMISVFFKFLGRGFMKIVSAIKYIFEKIYLLFEVNENSTGMYEN